MDVYDRAENLPVDFLFWSSRKVGGRWKWNWSTFSREWVTQRDNNPVSMRFDSSVDSSFNRLLAKKQFHTGGKTKIIIHGYTENGRGLGMAEWVKRMKDAYYDTGT